MKLRIGVFLPGDESFYGKYGVARYVQGMTLALRDRSDCDVKLIRFGGMRYSSESVQGLDTVYALGSGRMSEFRTTWLNAGQLRLPDNGLDLIFNPYPVGINTQTPVLTCIFDPEPFERGLPWHSELSWLSRVKTWYRYRRVVAKSRAIVTISSFSKSGIMRAFPHLNPNRVLITYCAPGELNTLNTNDRNHTPKNVAINDLPEWYFVQAGGLKRKKGGELILKIAQLTQDRPYKIVILGDLHEKPLLLKSKELSNLVFVGFVSDCELSRIYKDAHALLFTSQYEGFGMPIVEAMHLGTPVLGSDATSIPEVIGSGGQVIDSNSPLEWVKCMDALYEDISLRQSLRGRAFQRSEFFKWNKSAAVLVHEARQLVG